MWKNYVRAALATSLWTVSIALMVVASIKPASWVLMGWSALIALGGGTVTCWQMMVVERARVEHIAEIAARVAVKHSGLESVH